ncbi:hypothetical protein G5V58_08980 [Nocardioides anomalus]|uniref:Uncharacterized protein n=1 Tax=Nocardioides anomalus TaxID=2712223 RepID=A0A6G6WCC8_9ACTN|nr:hypothetical protein [Nocardioides anomalus]QIG42884.1 hypothetical protein G5V58_08980 [Nocardioides anomalus]
MSTLRDRLADLAEDARPGAPDPDLWGRGRRYARRRRAATVGGVLAVALLAALSAAGVAGRPLHPVQPAAPEGRTVLPDRIFTPSPRLPTADGPTGPLVAVLPAEHFDWLGHGAPGLVGVSAVDQSYAFLDLPGFLGDAGGQDTTWSLSTDGRWLSYWYGPTPDEAGTVIADGIAVLDTSTGAVRRHRFETEHGLAPQPVGWAGDTVYFAQYDYTELRDDGASATLVASFAWPAGADAPERVEDPQRLLASPSGPAGPDGFVASGAGRSWYAVRQPSDLLRTPLARLRLGQTQPARVALGPDGQTLAWVQPDQGGSTGQLTTAPVGDGQPVSPVEAGVGRFPSLVGWLDDDRVVLETARDGRLVLEAVDVTSGEVEVLSTFDRSYRSGEQLAVGLLDSPVVDAVPPPQPHDPRLVAAGVGAGVLLLLLLGLVLWRRRAR